MNMIRNTLFSTAAPSRNSLNGLALFMRVVFALTLFKFFWTSAMTKFDGFLRLSDGVYGQMFPRAFEAVGFDASQMGFFYKFIAFFGSVSEAVLPMLIVIGLFSRPAALAMIGFILVMTNVDVTGHGASLGRLFDSQTFEIIDVRLYWAAVLVAISVLGGGFLSVDSLISRRLAK